MCIHETALCVPFSHCVYRRASISLHMQAHTYVCKLLQFLHFHSISSPRSSTSPCTAPLPHPAPVMTDAHPMAKQQPTEPSDDQG